MLFIEIICALQGPMKLCLLKILHMFSVFYTLTGNYHNIQKVSANSITPTLYSTFKNQLDFWAP